MRMIPALFVFVNDTCDTMTLDRRYIYVCSSSVTNVITVTTVIKKTDRAVTIGTIKIGTVLSSLAYLLSDDEKLFAAVSQQIFFLFLPISLLTKCAYPFRAIPLFPTLVGAASIALWHPPALCGRSLARMREHPHPLFYQRKEKTNGEKTDRAYESSYDTRGKENDF